MKKKSLLIGSNGYVGREISKILSESKKHEVIVMNGKDATDVSVVNTFFNNVKNQDISHIIYCVSAPVELKNFKNTDFSEIQKHIDVQVKGLFYILKNVIDNGKLESIQIIGSTCLFGRPPARMLSYTIAKYALLGFCKALVSELSSKRIRVNMISPGLTGKGVSNAYPSTYIELTEINTPLGRLVNSTDIADLVLFLISDKAKYMTGLNIALDGGLSVI